MKIVASMADPENIAVFCGRQRRSQLRHQRTQVSQSIAATAQDNNGDIVKGEILLKRKISIYSDENFKLFFRQCEKITVFDSCLSHSRDGLDFVAIDFIREASIDAFIE
jgi:hypothetical protein